MAPKRKGKAPSAPTAKAPKADPNKPSDKQLCNILKCFVELCATSYFPDSVHRSSGTLLSTSDGVTLTLDGGAKKFLASLPLAVKAAGPLGGESMREAWDVKHEALCADYASAVVSARLQYGDFNLNDGECRWQPVRFRRPSRRGENLAHSAALIGLSRRPRCCRWECTSSPSSCTSRPRPSQSSGSRCSLTLGRVRPRGCRCGRLRRE